jgi:hypothetical protein
MEMVNSRPSQSSVILYSSPLPQLLTPQVPAIGTMETLRFSGAPFATSSMSILLILRTPIGPGVATACESGLCVSPATTLRCHSASTRATPGLFGTS